MEEEGRKEGGTEGENRWRCASLTLSPAPFVPPRPSVPPFLLLYTPTPLHKQAYKPLITTHLRTYTSHPSHRYTDTHPSTSAYHYYTGTLTYINISPFHWYTHVCTLTKLQYPPVLTSVYLPCCYTGTPTYIMNHSHFYLHLTP